jgi:hypothetical protein
MLNLFPSLFGVTEDVGIAVKLLEADCEIEFDSSDA